MSVKTTLAWFILVKKKNKKNLPWLYGYTRPAGPPFPPQVVSSLLFSHIVHAEELNILKADSFQTDTYIPWDRKNGGGGRVDQVPQVTYDNGIEPWPLNLDACTKWSGKQK